MDTPQVRKGLTLTAICGALSLAGTSPPASCATQAEQEQALRSVYEAADRICGQVAKKGTAQELELSGGAKAELANVLRKLANIGIEGTAKYRTSEYEGVLQQDLAKVLNTTTECRRDVFLRLTEVLLPQATSESASAADRARARTAVRNPRQYHWQCQVRVFDNASGVDIASGRLNFGPVTYGPNISYANAAFDTLRTSRLSQNVTFEKAAWAFFGECKTMTCMSFLDESPPYDPVFVVQDAVFDEERGEMDLRGGVMVRTQGQHNFFAYLSGICKPR
jgi:hypothetical protein